MTQIFHIVQSRRMKNQKGMWFNYGGRQTQYGFDGGVCRQCRRMGMTLPCMVYGGDSFRFVFPEQSATADLIATYGILPPVF
ncbi:MAG: hypothetical protein RI556_12345 [Hydrogenovibrio sp.]|uniref:hypothetical protein n=1 Tax=Hydrogenovibrio sp. TaxID=2065821 RepID=UPI0028708BD2|nr:hypothetical protein [Hydrogenovibrio sp.]MDR9499959.1 hypothetical protein [Hydrogenovibrio sp.]